jgi:hypothetical protein
MTRLVERFLSTQPGTAQHDGAEATSARGDGAGNRSPSAVSSGQARPAGGQAPR